MSFKYRNNGPAFIALTLSFWSVVSQSWSNFVCLVDEVSFYLHSYFLQDHLVVFLVLIVVWEIDLQTLLEVV